MARFAILLGGTLSVTPRLLRQIAGARAIAADSGMMHAETLGLEPELWAGDFDSASDAMLSRHVDIPRLSFPAEKDATDGEIAIAEALKRGASSIVLVGGLGGQADHTLGILGATLRLAKQGTSAIATSGFEEAWPLVAGEMKLDLARGNRISIVPYADFEGLDLSGVKWPLTNRSVPLGSSLTLSNIATGPVTIRLRKGYGIVIAYPCGDAA
jgi:thiamine pyrophosphokinase